MKHFMYIYNKHGHDSYITFNARREQIQQEDSN